MSSRDGGDGDTPEVGRKQKRRRRVVESSSEDEDEKGPPPTVVAATEEPAQKAASPSGCASADGVCEAIPGPPALTPEAPSFKVPSSEACEQEASQTELPEIAMPGMTAVPGQSSGDQGRLTPLSQDPRKVVHAARMWLTSAARRADPLMAARAGALTGLTKQEAADFVEANKLRKQGEWSFQVLDARLEAKRLEQEAIALTGQGMPLTANALAAAAPESLLQQVARSNPREATGRRRFVPNRPGKKGQQATCWMPCVTPSVADIQDLKTSKCKHANRSKAADQGCLWVCLDCGEALLFDGWRLEYQPDNPWATGEASELELKELELQRKAKADAFATADLAEWSH